METEQIKPVQEQVQADRSPKSFKTITNLVSVLLPAILIAWMSSYPNDPDPGRGTPFLIGLAIWSIYLLILYSLAGGGDWSRQKYSVAGMIFFYIFSGLALGLLVYGFWYLIRVVMAKIYKLPMAEAKGRTFTK